MLSGRAANIPYSLSRWTDVPGSKWLWMQQQFRQGWMTAFDQRTSLPDKWSLHPDDTLGLIWWTKDPSNLIKESALLRSYRNKIHVTATGWEEVEKGAPSIRMSGQLLVRTSRAFGPENVTWRFSPVPAVENVTERFETLACYAQEAGLSEVFLAFLQNNDLMPEERSSSDRLDLMQRMANIGSEYGIQVKLCNEDRSLKDIAFPNLSAGICAPPEAFGLPGVPTTPSEGCGCGYAVDPFTINETCTFGCKYCYAADLGTAPKKRNTTRLPVIR